MSPGASTNCAQPVFDYGYTLSVLFGTPVADRCQTGAGPNLVSFWSNLVPSLVPIWFQFGAQLVPVWSLFGPSLVPVWSPVGLRLVPVWSQFGPRLVSVWSPFGPRLVSVWSPFGPSLVPVWSQFGSSSVPRSVDQQLVDQQLVDQKCFHDSTVRVLCWDNFQSRCTGQVAAVFENGGFRTFSSPNLKATQRTSKRWSHQLCTGYDLPSFFFIALHCFAWLYIA